MPGSPRTFKLQATAGSILQETVQVGPAWEQAIFSG